MRIPFFHYEFVSQKGVDNLQHYAYRGVDNSISARLFLNAVWSAAVEWLPRWLAPNVITLAGGLFMLAAYVICALSSPNLTEPVSPLCLVVSAALIWLYQLADNLDGKQAKRTKNGSALGELFDHGVDSIVMGLIGGLVCCVMRGPATLSMVGVLLTMAPFYLSHWEEYHAGILIMGQFNGPTELQHAVCGTLLYTAWAGSDVWLRPLPLLPQYSYHHGFFVLIGAFSAVGVCGSVLNVYKLTSTRKSELGSTPSEAMSQPLPFALFSGLSLAWVYATPDNVSAHPQAHFMALTLIFAYLTQRLLVQRICKEPFRAAYSVQVPLALTTINGIACSAGAPCVPPVVAMWALLAVAFVQEVVFVVSIINQLCAALHIRPFIVKKVSSP